MTGVDSPCYSGHMMAKKTTTSLNPAKPILPEEYYKARIKGLSDMYGESSKRIQAILAKDDTSDFKRWRMTEIDTQIKAEIRGLDVKARREAPGLSEEAYNRGIGFTTQTARGYGIDDSINMGNVVHRQAVSIVSDQMTQDLLSANESIGKNVHRMLMATQQRVLQERQINRAIGAGLIEGRTRLGVSGQIEADLRSKIQVGQMLHINGRDYDPADYAALVARTRTREAASQGTVNASLELGLDLLQIDVHGDACPLCQLRQGRVYSISGANPDFPKLESKPPFHPNCECNAFPVNEQVLKDRGQYDQLSELSKGTRQTMVLATAKDWLSAHPDMGILSLKDYNRAIEAEKVEEAVNGGSFPLSTFKSPTSLKASASKLLIKEQERWMVDNTPTAGSKIAKAREAKFKIVKELSKESGVELLRTNELIMRWAQSSNDNDYTAMRMQMAVARNFDLELTDWQKEKLLKVNKTREEEISKWVESGSEISKNSLHVLEKGNSYVPRLDSLTGNFKSIEEAEDAFIKAMYKNTQESLKKSGIKSLLVHRGVIIPSSDPLFKSPGMRETLLGANLKESTTGVMVKGENRIDKRWDDAELLGSNPAESWSTDLGTALAFGGSKISADYEPNSGALLSAEIPAERILGSCVSGYGCLNESEVVVLGTPRGKKDRISILSHTVKYVK